MSKVWLVTGSASGLGRNIAEAVLESGDRLVATARDPRRLEDLAEEIWRSGSHRSPGRGRRRCGPCRGAGGGGRVWTSRCRREQRGIRRYRAVRTD